MVCPSDQVATPSYGPDVARVVAELLDEGWSGVVHVAGPDVMDRIRFARELADSFGLDPSLITGKSTAQLGQGAPRPLNGGLLTPRLDAWRAGAMPALARCLSDFRARLSDPATELCPLDSA
jgi:dTDP-4-dehydrorhamnose reductase